MAQITTLKDKEGQTLYPITSSKAVLDENGIDLETRLNGKVEKVQGKGLSSNDYTNADKQKLDSLPTNDELTQQLNGKQPMLQSSVDVEVDGNELALTERVKQQAFIDMWNNACNYYKIRYDITVGGYYPDEAPDIESPFLLNGIWLTYDQAIRTLLLYPLCASSVNKTFAFARCPLPTLFPLVFENYGSASIDQTFMNNGYIKKIVIFPNVNTKFNFIAASWTFSDCTQLEEIIGTIKTNNIPELYHVYKLREIRLQGITAGGSFAYCPQLSRDSINFLITHAANTSAITITVHPDVYAKLTGDETNEAYNNLTDEEKQPWTALLAQAAEKNIQFASA